MNPEGKYIWIRNQTEQKRKLTMQENKNYAMPESCMQPIIIDLDVLC